MREITSIATFAGHLRTENFVRGCKMPLTKAGKKVKENMMHEYGEKKGEQVFYATMNKMHKKMGDKNGMPMMKSTGKKWER